MCKNIKWDLHPTPYTNINSKWIKGLNIKAKLLIYQKKTLRGKLHDTRCRNDFLDMTPKA